MTDKAWLSFRGSKWKTEINVRDFIQHNYTQYNGIYTARDTGGAIKNYKIDLFMGDFQNNQPSQEALNFGVTKAEVTILR